MNFTVKYAAPEHWTKISSIDMHTGGEPLRVLLDGLPEIHGESILEKRRYFRDNLDHIRTGTMFEPRGHADMYGAVLTGPTSPGADFGTFFLHNEGYSTMCGHAIIALTKLVLETGMIAREGPDVELNIDAPPGRIISRARFIDGKVSDIKFINVPSFVLYSDQELELEGRKIHFDVAYGGAFYAFVDDPELSLDLENASELIRFGRIIKERVAEKLRIVHPFEDDLSFLYGTIFTGKAHEQVHHSRNVCIFADGELDRSPTGSGISARAAIHYSRGELALQEWISIESILGTLMKVRVKGVEEFGGLQAVIPEVSGTAHYTGRSEFWFDPEDPLKEGFIIR